MCINWCQVFSSLHWMELCQTVSNTPTPYCYMHKSRGGPGGQITKNMPWTPWQSLTTVGPPLWKIIWICVNRMFITFLHWMLSVCVNYHSALNAFRLSITSLHWMLSDCPLYLHFCTESCVPMTFYNQC